MPRDVFRKRAAALEDAFFHQVDQELAEKFREQQQLETDEDALTIATGITDRAVLDELISVQVTPQSLAAFSMFPAIHVAWSDGHVKTEERAAVLKAAKHLGIVEESAAHELLSSWLDNNSAGELFGVWKDFIQAICPTMSVHAFGQLRSGAIERATAVADAAGGILGFSKITNAEAARLSELDAVFANAIEANAPVQRE